MRRLYDSVVPLFDACIRKFAPVGPFVQTPELLGGKHARRWGSFDGWLSAPDVPDHVPDASSRCVRDMPANSSSVTPCQSHP